MSHEVFHLEQAAMARWCKGDPDGFLALCAEEVSYLDPFSPQRLDGLPALRSYYEGLRGKISATSYEFQNVRVQEWGDCALLSYHFHSQGPDGSMNWNCSEVFRRQQQGWRIVHTHWSLRNAPT